MSRSAQLCVRWDVREDVAGASFMAFGNACPEILVNAVATIKDDGTNDLASSCSRNSAT